MGNIIYSNFDLKFSKEDNILYWKLNGIIDKDYLINIIEQISNYSKTIKNLRIIETEGDYKLEISISQFPSIIKKGFEIIKQFESIKHAGVINSPKNTAFFTLLANGIPSKKLKIKIFSEFENARIWIEQE